MKKHALIFAVLASFSFSCSNEDVNESIDQSSILETQVLVTNSTSYILKSEKFKDYLFSKKENVNALNRASSSEGNQRLIILDDGYNISFGAIAPDFGSFIVIGGQGSITQMPNGRAKFSIHTRNPNAYYIEFDFPDNSFEMTSDCVDGNLGNFNYNLISEYVVDIWEYEPGLFITSYYPTFINSSAESGNGHCKVSDALPIYNEDFTEIIGCGEATFYKTIRLKGNKNKGYTIALE